MPPIVMQNVRTAAVAGVLMNAVVQPCAQHGVIAVTLQYPAALPTHDVTVEIIPLYVDKRVVGDTTYFRIAAETDYAIRLSSPNWSGQIDIDYAAEGRINHHTVVAIPLVVPAITITLQDHHFVPGVETLRGHYTPANLQPDTLKLTIRGTHYGGDIVFQRDAVASANGNQSIDALGEWDGLANRGALDGLALSPLYSPDTVRVEAENTRKVAEAQFHVLYHSVTLALGTYTADGAAPIEGAAPERWVQHKLNELGYFAGPVDGVIGAQTQRAMVRYAFGHPTLSERTAGHAGAGYANNVDFRAALRANEQPRTIIQNAALPAHDAAARIYVDHNYFYVNLPDFQHDTGHVNSDADYLDRFEIPIQATILLMSRGDADGTGVGIASPRAVGDVAIEWSVDEAAEDTTRLPDGTDPDIPSRTRAYVAAALTATRGAGRTNCPSTLGGARQAVDPNTAYFRIGNDLPPFTSTAPGGDVVSTAAHQGSNDQRGKAGVLFRGSYVAGDNYRITARISFRGRPHENALQAAHRQVRNNAAWDDILRARTGRMTLWRQHRIAAVVNWPAPAQAINWAAVAAEYAKAYCELDHNNAIALSAAQMRARHFEGDPVAPTFEEIVGACIGGTLRIDRTIGNVTWSNNSLFHTNFTVPAQGPTDTAREFVRRVQSDAGAALSTLFLQSYATAVSSFVGERGGIIVHGRWIPAVRATHRALWGHGRDGAVEDFELGIKCIGLTRGVVVLSHSMFPDYQDRFIVTHEMGHSRFLNHHETGSNPQANRINAASDTPTHHDLRDHNCTMCYPWGIPTRNPRIGTPVSWGRASTNHSAFCGKCILKLRGWDVVTGPMPASS